MEILENESNRGINVMYPVYLQPLLIDAEFFQFPKQYPTKSSNAFIDLNKIYQDYPNVVLNCALLENGNIYVIDLEDDMKPLKERLKLFKTLSSLYTSDYLYFLNSFKAEDKEEKDYYIDCFKLQGFSNYVASYEEK